MAEEEQGTDRRQFLAKSAGAVAGLPLSARSWTQVAGANGKVRIAMIGVGIRGLQLLRNTLAEPGFEVVAASDLYDGHLARARELAGAGLPVTKRYAEILARKDIDAVVIAVPDFWHKKVVFDALEAGKHVYCEKPLLHHLEDGDDFKQAVRRSGKILQVGSQHVSSPHVIEARRRIEAGELGQITQIKTTWDTNTPISAWQMPIPGDASAATIDWPTYQEQATQKYAFDARRFFSWRRYRDYGESLAGDVLVHMITTVHFVMGVAAAPPLTMAAGGLFRWKDGRTAYDAISILNHYPEGFIANYEANQNNQFLGQHIQILGSKATMDLTFMDFKIYKEVWPLRWSYAVESWARPEREVFYGKNGGAPDPHAVWKPQAAPTPSAEWTPDPGALRNGRMPHMTAFIDALRSGRQPVEDVVMGVEAATTALLGNLSLRQKKAIEWDRAGRRMM